MEDTDVTSPSTDGQGEPAPDQVDGQEGTPDTPEASEPQAPATPETPDAPSGATPESMDREQLLNAYNEQRKWLTKLSMDVSDLRRSTQGPSKDLSPEEQEQAQVRTLLESEIQRATAPMRQEMAMNRFRQELSLSKMKYPLAQDDMVASLLMKHDTMTTEEATRKSHETVVNIQKKAVDAYVAKLEAGKGGPVAKSGPPVLQKGKLPRTPQEASAAAMSIFESATA